MNVKGVILGTNRPDQLRTQSVDQANKAQTSAASESKAESASLRDRVEISEAARAASEDLATRQREIDFARKALLSQPPLSPDRAEDIFKRINEGYYSSPDVLQKVSTQFASEAGLTPEGGQSAEGSGEAE